MGWDLEFSFDTNVEGFHLGLYYPFVFLFFFTLLLEERVLFNSQHPTNRHSLWIYYPTSSNEPNSSIKFTYRSFPSMFSWSFLTFLSLAPEISPLTTTILTLRLLSHTCNPTIAFLSHTQLHTQKITQIHLNWLLGPYEKLLYLL